MPYEIGFTRVLIESIDRLGMFIYISNALGAHKVRDLEMYVSL